MDKKRALYFAEKFPNTYRVLSKIETPKKREEKKETTSTFMDDDDKKTNTTETTSDLVKKINAITKENISELEQYLSHEMKTVKNAAERKMKELTNIKTN